MSQKGNEIYEMNKKYTMFTWTAQETVDPLCVAKVDGIYMYDFDGKEYIDLTSQLVNVNIGFGNKAMVKAIQDMAAKMPYIAPKLAFEERGELGRLLIEEVAPKNMAKVLYTNGGADANEYAIRLAKAFTGKDKIFSKYESYHGSTYGAANLTGEAKRSSPFPTIPGFIRFPAPHLYHYDIDFESEEAATAHFLSRLEYQIQLEGANNIAALFIEPVTGSNGVYLYPKGYLKGVRELCTKYGIVMVADEVMDGFLRTGKWFSFEHEEILPDIITIAKGINSGYVPLGGVLISKEISEFFDTTSLPGGLTYNAHGLAMASAIACINEYKRMDTMGHVNKLAPIFAEKLESYKAKYKSIGDVRHIGLFGAIELVKDPETKEMHPLNNAKLYKALYDEGLSGLNKDSIIMVAPPLIITEEQMEEMFKRLEVVLAQADEML